MADYLRKYVGTYRVKSDYDLDTNDWVKLPNGENDTDFDGQYIQCKNNIKIRHVSKTSQLACYIPSKTKGINILKQIYLDKIGGKLPEDETTESKKYSDSLVLELNKKILNNVEVLDYEVYFEFKNDLLPYIATLVVPFTKGADISPFSVNNLPKSNYIIPNEDLLLYKESIKELEMYEINQANKEFLLKYGLHKDKGMKPKEFIHKQNMWNEYVEFLKEIKGVKRK